MSIYKSALELIEKGRQGGNAGLPMGFDRLTEYIPNIQQSTKYLIGGESGSGKTGLADDAFMYNPFDWLMENKGNTDIKAKFIYFSYEIEKRRKIIKGICRRIYKKYNIIVDVNYVLSRGKHRVSNGIYEKVVAVADYFEELEDMLVIYDLAMHPTKMDIILNKHFKENGQLVKTGEYEFEYKPNNENLYTIGMLDHYGLIKGEEGAATAKLKIDKTSNMLVRHRNVHRMTSVELSQFNRAMSSTDRFKLEMVKPQASDFKDSGNSYEDADIVMALLSTKKYGIASCGGYKCGLLDDRFRGLAILKNRDGDADLMIGMGFIGELGHFKELPHPSTMTDAAYTNTLNAINERKYKPFELL